MNESENANSSHRWPRGQKVRLSPLGTEAELTYRNTIVSARDQGGRSAFDDARGAWSTSLKIKPEDGQCLVELETGPMTLSKISEELDACGTNPKEVRASLERLLDAGLVEFVPDLSR